MHACVMVARWTLQGRLVIIEFGENVIKNVKMYRQVGKIDFWSINLAIFVLG